MPLRRWLAVIVLTAWMALSAPTASLAQFAPLEQLPKNALSALTGPAAPRSDKPSAMVSLDKRDLFPVYAQDKAAAVDRADLVGYRLESALRAVGDGPAPVASASSLGQDMVVTLGSQPLLTVTSLDTSAYGLPPVELASQWASKLTAAMAQAQRERRPDYLKTALLQAGLIVLVGALLHLLVSILFRRRKTRIGWPADILIWLFVVHFILEIFPLTRPLDAALTTGSLRPVSIFIVVALASAIVTRLLDLFLARLFPPVPDSLTFDTRTGRALQRRATLGVVARVTSISIVWVISLVTALSWAGINVSALLASAGLIGVAIGLAAQDTFKDIVAGINILADDRFGVGDYVQIGDYEGTVENLNLRITQIRDMAGNLITFPNHMINAVSNQTQRWAQVDLKIGVAYETDLRRALDLLDATSAKLAEDWGDKVLGPPVVLGVESFTESNVLLRVLMKTAPGDQWMVARELRLRLKEAYDAAGVIIVPQPRSIVAVHRADDGDAPSTNGTDHAENRSASAAPS